MNKPRRIYFAISIFLSVIVFWGTSCSGASDVQDPDTENSNIQTTPQQTQENNDLPTRNPEMVSITPTEIMMQADATDSVEEIQPVSVESLTGTVMPEITMTPTKTQTQTRTPTRTKVPTKTRVPSNTPTNTRIPATPVPQDAPVRIFIPASFSKVTAPLKLLVAVVPGSGGNVHMRLTGENDRIILQKKWIFPFANGRRTTIDEEFDLQISGVAESARLTIYTLDDYGRVIALSSEDILLISIGDTDLVEATNIMDAFTIRSPYPEKNIHHGVVEVSGITRTRVASTIFMELVDQNGTIVGSYASDDVIEPSLEYQIIDIDIPYQIKSPKWVRLIMHHMDTRTGKDVAIASMVLKLYP